MPAVVAQPASATTLGISLYAVRGTSPDGSERDGIGHREPQPNSPDAAQNRRSRDPQQAPNPVVDELTIEFEAAEAGLYQLEVVDLTGKALLRNEHNVISGNNTIRLNVSQIPSGLYYTRLTNKESNFTVKFVK